MKVVILAGGQQSTISDTNDNIPKPMAEIGNKPILWHIMKQFSYYGFNDFIVCGGYKVNQIKDYFMDYYVYQSDITVDLSANTVEIHKKVTEDWKVTVVDTGVYSTTGQRVNRIEKYIYEDSFIVVYGDCLSDINVHKVLEEHVNNHKLVTMTLARPTGRSREVGVSSNGSITGRTTETQDTSGAWANACMFVFDKEVFRYIQGNYELDKQLIPELAMRDQVVAYKHSGFWNPVETKRDKNDLDCLWNAELAPWKVWN